MIKYINKKYLVAENNLITREKDSSDLKKKKKEKDLEEYEFIKKEIDNFFNSNFKDNINYNKFLSSVSKLKIIFENHQKKNIKKIFHNKTIRPIKKYGIEIPYLDISKIEPVTQKFLRIKRENRETFAKQGVIKKSLSTAHLNDIRLTYKSKGKVRLSNYYDSNDIIRYSNNNDNYGNRFLKYSHKQTENLNKRNGFYSARGNYKERNFSNVKKSYEGIGYNGYKSSRRIN